MDKTITSLGYGILYTKSVDVVRFFQRCRVNCGTSTAVLNKYRATDRKTHQKSRQFKYGGHLISWYSNARIRSSFELSAEGAFSDRIVTGGGGVMIILPTHASVLGATRSNGSKRNLLMA